MGIEGAAEGQSNDVTNTAQQSLNSSRSGTRIEASLKVKLVAFMLSLVTVSPIREVYSSPFSSCLVQNELGNADLYFLAF